jgi:hypothetical protein
MLGELKKGFTIPAAGKRRRFLEDWFRDDLLHLA